MNKKKKNKQYFQYTDEEQEYVEDQLIEQDIVYFYIYIY
jgi:hypothetical protein